MTVALEVCDLHVTYPGPPPVRAVGGLSLTVGRGECLGILGESGSGKSTLARALLGIADGTVEGGRFLDGLDLGALDEAGWRDVRWRRIALSFQAVSSLNPVLRVGVQMAESMEAHLDLDRAAALTRSADLLEQVGLGGWANDRHPHELSGGQRRLVLVAMALACDPEVVVLDEPTSGLDPVVRDRVLGLLASLPRQGKALVVLTHDVDALEALADRVVLMYRGRVAEIGRAGDVLRDPRHPYSWALLNARPTLGTVKDLRGIRGDPPDPTEAAPGCPFVGRCTQSVPECDDAPPPLVPPTGEDGERRVACIRGGTVVVLAARHLSKAYRTSGGVLARRPPVPAVDDVSLEVREGEVVALVGPTGAGKSTLGLLLARLLEADGGQVIFEGRDLLAAGGGELKSARRRLQVLFQDPFETLSPRLTVAAAVREPLDVQGIGSKADRLDEVSLALAAVHLPTDEAFLSRRAHELSGGQLQRVALARALALRPKLLVADEPVSMLDASEQAKVLALLKHLQVEAGMAMVLISHDLATVLRVADRVLVLDGGRIVEHGTGNQLLVSPQHPVTQALLRSAGRDGLFVDAAAGWHTVPVSP